MKRGSCVNKEKNKIIKHCKRYGLLVLLVILYFYLLFKVETSIRTEIMIVLFIAYAIVNMDTIEELTIFGNTIKLRKQLEEAKVILELMNDNMYAVCEAMYIQQTESAIYGRNIESEVVGKINSIEILYESLSEENKKKITLSRDGFKKRMMEFTTASLLRELSRTQMWKNINNSIDEINDIGKKLKDEIVVGNVKTSDEIVLQFKRHELDYSESEDSQLKAAYFQKDKFEESKRIYDLVYNTYYKTN